MWIAKALTNGRRKRSYLVLPLALPIHGTMQSSLLCGKASTSLYVMHGSLLIRTRMTWMRKPSHQLQQSCSPGCVSDFILFFNYETYRNQITSQKFNKHELPSLILGMYNRTVQDPQTVWDLCSFRVCPPTTSESSHFERVHSERSILFQSRFRRYIFGSGPPLHETLAESGLLNQTDIDSQAGDPALRARLFLKAVTDSVQIPIDGNYQIQVSNPCCQYLQVLLNKGTV